MPADARLKPALEQLTTSKVPGLSAAVVRDGAIAEAASAGMADVANARPATSDTAYLWFSMTKIVTATAAMQLAESGALSLDDPVAGLVPEFPEPRSGWPQVQVSHLMSHSSGLSNPVPVRWVHPAGSPGRDPHDFAVELLQRHPRLRFPAGSKAVYSNLGYIVLGEVIAAASGASYEDYVSAHILEPLSMQRTAFSYDALGDDLATGYQSRLSPMTPLFRLVLPSGIVGEKAGRFIAFNRFYVDGPAYGGLVGSTHDAARFMAVHINDGELDGVRLLSPESVRAMQTIQASGRRIDVGFGWFRRGSDRSGGEPHLEHLGGGGGFWNMMRIYPDRNLGVVAMGNATSYDHDLVARAALGDE
jgi:CubicO group peptidase (beta-lactamase class C family)